MLLVHPVHEVLRQIPVLIGSFVLGSATGNPAWAILAVVLIVAFGLARWFTTAYRIGGDDVQLRSGVLQRTVVSLPRNRIRSVSTDARLLHRMLGLTVVTVSTGQQASTETAFALDAVPAAEVPHLRAILLAESLGPAAVYTQGQVLARWQPSWLRYSALTFGGLITIGAAAGVLSQTGVLGALDDSPWEQAGAGLLNSFGVAAVVAAVVVALVLASVALSVAQSLLSYANLELRRDADILHLSHGLVRVRERTFDMRRLRGGTLREPLLVRLFGGARLDAVMTGVAGVGEASQLLPPCPRQTASTVLRGLIGEPQIVDGPLRPHGPAAVRRRWIRAMALPVVAAVALAVTASLTAVPVWAWVIVGLLVIAGAALAADRARALGHRVDNGWLAARAGSLGRRRDCVAGAGIVAWTVRQTWPQRRVGVATLVAATAAGVKRYEVVDVPADQAWAIAAAVSPWVGASSWARD
ncbi:PH domain-containing protein [Mycobacterium sp. SMC-4]|uniref:PH domain-containing protein n=1 Tax=Mycobacterium sp. SMC-4 TaxID=2857059 RepID=UPI0021B3A908|nr:PH domain-containing protein [Mycobacterium sp. SMC-4]UXA20517.1 PH domain-containing protein [Mycobacterium sp. SMC-4]